MQKSILAQFVHTGMYILTGLENYQEHGQVVDTEAAVDIESLIG